PKEAPLQNLENSCMVLNSETKVDHCYEIFRETKGWEEALASCQREGSHLASIQNLEEHSFMVSRLGYGECFQGRHSALSDGNDRQS
uniref:C-type lectin domain-containing protein n=1 Tax=Amazona collaria TaxID=241587 RepID=A0A8B9GHS8_9PSIT